MELLTLKLIVATIATAWLGSNLILWQVFTTFTLQ